MDGKRVLITGATQGIGRAAAREFARAGACVSLVARDERRADVLAQELQALGSPAVDILLADLSRPAEASRAGMRFAAAHDSLDVLVNNAGGVFTKRQLTEDGFEKTFALNHLSYVALTRSVLECLEHTEGARIVNTASHAHYMIDDIQWDDIHMAERWGRRGWDAYCQSKLANVMWTRWLSRKLADSITVNAFHPGWVRTGLGRNNGLAGKLLVPFISLFGARTPEKGAETLVYAAMSPSVAGLTGAYLFDREVKKPSAAARDEAKQERLMRITDEMLARL